MRDKIALRDLADGLLPAEIVERPKQPYRAPEVAPFFSDDAPAWVADALGAGALEETGIWDAGRVEGLLRRCRTGRATGVREGMALVGILTTQLWHQAFCGAGRDAYSEEPEAPRVRIDRTRDKLTGETV
jgi:asparagine synthase (glutamine-hydrolysing)